MVSPGLMKRLYDQNELTPIMCSEEGGVSCIPLLEYMKIPILILVALIATAGYEPSISE